jgi:YVTN family beta-propeller protein
MRVCTDLRAPFSGARQARARATEALARLGGRYRWVLCAHPVQVPVRQLRLVSLAPDPLGWRGGAVGSRMWRAAVTAALVLFTVCGCSAPRSGYETGSRVPAARPRLVEPSGSAASERPIAWQFRNPLPGMPPVIGNDVYSQTRRGMLSPVVAKERGLLYVPDSRGSTVTVIDQHTRKVIKVIPTGFLSQHVVPSYDLRTLLVNASYANELVALSPRRVRRTHTSHVPRPYNLYFTPDGRSAVVMVEQHNMIRFSDPHTFKVQDEVSPHGCRGPNHADFSANGRFFVVTCEFSGELVKISTTTRRVVGTLRLGGKSTLRGGDSMRMATSMPQDIRLSPDGRTFYVADMGTNELRLVSARTFRQVGAIGMPSHPHGIYPSRDGSRFYISDRGAGEVSVLDPATNKIRDTWTIPGGGSPDMGGVSADGRMLWLSGRYDRVVYGFDTQRGKLVARIPVQGSPHGLAVWPQPGRYSLGHTGNMR